MLLGHREWDDAAGLVNKGLEGPAEAKTGTYVLGRQLEGATKVWTSQIGDAIIQHM